MENQGRGQVSQLQAGKSVIGKEDFVFQWKHEFGGMVLAPMRGNPLPTTSMEVERVFRKIEANLNIMYDQLVPVVPIAPPDPAEPWRVFFSYEPALKAVNDKMIEYNRIDPSSEIRGEIRKVIAEYTDKQGWQWSKDISAFEPKNSGPHTIGIGTGKTVDTAKATG